MGIRKPRAPVDGHARVRRAARALLGWALVLAAAAAVAVALRTDAVAQVDDVSREQIEQGGALYAVHCATCHGALGEGGSVPGGAPAPALAGREDVTVPYVDLVMRVGRMPPAGDPFDNRARNVVLSEFEREAILAYTRTAFDLEGEVPNPPPGEASRGMAVYQANCAACHGAAGAGGVAGAGAWTPPVNRYDPVIIAEAIRVGPFEMPRFERSQVSAQEVGDIAAFLHELSEEHGTPVLGLVELNPVYASGFAFLFAVISILSAIWISGRPTWFPDPEEPRDGGQSAEEAP